MFNEWEGQSVKYLFRSFFVFIALAICAPSMSFAMHRDPIPVPIVQIMDVAVIPDTPKLDKPALIVEADRLYRSQNQPGQTFRVAVEAYRHIDPGRMVA